MTTGINIKIGSKIFKIVREIAKKENTTEIKIINQILKTSLEKRTNNKIPNLVG